MALRKKLAKSAKTTVSTTPSNTHKTVTFRSCIEPQFVDVVSEMWGEVYLDLPMPEKNEMFPDVEIELNEDLARRLIHSVLRFPEDDIKAALTDFIGAISAEGCRFMEFLQQACPGFKELDFKNFSIFNLHLLLGANLRNISIKESKLQGHLVLNERQLVNINKWIENFNSFTGQEIPCPFTKSAFTGCYSQLVSKSCSLDLLTEKIYFGITGNPNDFLRMSLSPFYSSCQSVYGDGREAFRVLPNVFDPNVKLAIFYIKKEYTDERGRKHPNCFIARRLLRVTTKGVSMARTYPVEDAYKLRQVFTDIVGDLGFTGFYDIRNEGRQTVYTVDPYDLAGLERPYSDDGLTIGLCPRYPDFSKLSPSEREQVRAVFADPKTILSMEEPSEAAQIVAFIKQPFLLSMYKGKLCEKAQIIALVRREFRMDAIGELDSVPQRLLGILIPELILDHKIKNFEVVQSAIKRTPELYEAHAKWINETFSPNELFEIVIHYIRLSGRSPRNCECYSKLSPTQQEALWMAVIDYDCNRITLFPEATENLWIYAIKSGFGLHGVPAQFFTKAVCEAAVERDPGCIGKVPANLQTEVMQLAAVQHDWKLLADCVNPTHKVCQTALSKSAEAILHVENPTDKLTLMALLKDPALLRFIPNPSPIVVAETVRNNPLLLEFVEDIASPKLKREILEKEPLALRFIPDPSEKMISSAIERNPDVIMDLREQKDAYAWQALRKDVSTYQYLRNPSYEMSLYAVEHGYLESLVSYNFYTSLRKMTTQLLSLCLKKRPDFFQNYVRYHGTFVTPELMREALERDFTNIKHVRKELFEQIYSEAERADFCWNIVETNPVLIFDIEDLVTKEQIKRAIVNDLEVLERISYDIVTYGKRKIGQCLLEIAENEAEFNEFEKSVAAKVENRKKQRAAATV